MLLISEFLTFLFQGELHVSKFEKAPNDTIFNKILNVFVFKNKGTELFILAFAFKSENKQAAHANRDKMIVCSIYKTEENVLNCNIST